MNRCQRRLLQVFLETGGDIADGTGLDTFTTFVQSQVMLLSPAVRRAVSMVLDQGEAVSYGIVAEALSREEVRPVSVPSVRARISRGMRTIEYALRRRTSGPSRSLFDGARNGARMNGGGRLNGQPALHAASVAPGPSASDMDELWRVPPGETAYA